MISLQPCTETDLKRILSWVTNAEDLLKWAGPKYQWPLCQKQLSATLLKTKNSPQYFYMFKAIQTDISEVVGHVELSVNLEESTAHVGRVLIAKKFRGKNLGYSLITSLMNYSKFHLKLRKLTLNVFSNNLSALNCYKKSGFIVYNEKKNSIIFENENWDLIQMHLPIDKDRIYL